MGIRFAASRWLSLLISVAPLLCLAGQMLGQTPAPTAATAGPSIPLTDAQVHDKVSNLLKQMTLEEKVAQL